MKHLVATALAAAMLSCGPAAENATAPSAGGGRSADGEVAQPEATSPRLSRLAGRKWRLTRFDRAAAVPDAIVITLELESGRISGSAGCNRYFASVTEGDRPGEITIGPVGVTRRACSETIMNAESRFLDALAHVVRYDLPGEGVSLIYRVETEDHTLLLVPFDTGP